MDSVGITLKVKVANGRPQHYGTGRPPGGYGCGLGAFSGEINPETGKIEWSKEDRNWTKLRQTSGPKKALSQEEQAEKGKKESKWYKKKREHEQEVTWGCRSVWVKGDDGELRPSAKYWPELTNKELLDCRLICPCGEPYSKTVYPRNVIIHCVRHKKDPVISDKEAAQILANLWREPTAPNFNTSRRPLQPQPLEQDQLQQQHQQELQQQRPQQQDLQLQRPQQQELQQQQQQQRQNLQQQHQQLLLQHQQQHQFDLQHRQQQQQQQQQQQRSHSRQATSHEKTQPEIQVIRERGRLRTTPKVITPPSNRATPEVIAQEGLCCEPEDPEVKILNEEIPGILPRLTGPFTTLHYLGPKDVNTPHNETPRNRSSSL